MPEFIPAAGFSPNCWAVLVQTAHWAAACCTEKSIKRAVTDIRKKYFMFAGQRYNSRCDDHKMFNRKYEAWLLQKSSNQCILQEIQTTYYETIFTCVFFTVFRFCRLCLAIDGEEFL